MLTKVSNSRTAQLIKPNGGTCYFANPTGADWLFKCTNLSTLHKHVLMHVPLCSQS